MMFITLKNVVILLKKEKHFKISKEKTKAINNNNKVYYTTKEKGEVNKN